MSAGHNHGLFFFLKRSAKCISILKEKHISNVFTPLISTTIYPSSPPAAGNPFTGHPSPPAAGNPFTDQHLLRSSPSPETQYTYKHKKETKSLEDKRKMGSREKDLKRSFKVALHRLLTTFSKQDFCKAFPKFTQAEQERMHRLYIKVIVSMHQNIEDDFERLCEETKLGSVLDTVEELVEEQTLDPLYPDKTNFKDVAQALSTSKKNEIQNLTAILEKSEEQKKVLRSRVELLRKEIQDLSGASNALGKAKTGALKNVTSNQA